MAAPTIQLKRGTNAVPSASALAGEPIIRYNSDITELHIGDAGGGATELIASDAAYDANIEILTKSVVESVDGNADGTNANIAITSMDITGSAVNLTVPSDLATSYTLTLPENDGGVDQVLTTDGNGVLSWTTPDGTLSATGTPVDGQIAVWTSATVLEGDAQFSFDTTGDTLNIGVTTLSSETGTIALGGETVLAQSAGTVTLSNISAIDATTETTIEAAIDTLANLTSASSLATVGTVTSGTWSASFGDALIQDLADISGTSTGDNQFIVSTGAGTFALEDAATARGSLDVDQAGTDNSTPVTLAGTPDYITISGQTITRNAIDLTTDVSGALPIANGGTGATTAADAATALGVGTTDNPSFAGATAGNIRVGITGDNEIDTSTGDLTIDSAGGTTTIDDNLIVSGNLTVSGTTTTVNTVTTTVEDRLFELGIVDGSAPSAETTWDSGVVFNYHDGSNALKSGVVWNDSESAIEILSSLGTITGDTSTGVGNPTIASQVYATVSLGSLYIGSASTATNEVIDSSKNVINVTIDAGTYT